MKLITFVSLLAFAGNGFAWNATGHRAIALIAYDHLTPNAKSRVDALLEKHPDYATLLTAGAPTDPEGRAQVAFLAASVWPDVIRSDKRFYDDTRADAMPTPLLPGFPYMARHTNWHYIDVPISADGAPVEPVKPPNALTELQRILKEINPPGDIMPAYDLPWLLHIVGDVHQPLHCVSRFVKSQPKGDAGGNNVFVMPGRNLHAVWDGAPGDDASDAFVKQYAAEVSAEFKAKNLSKVSKDPKKWIDEGVMVAKAQVYTFGPETGSREHPLVLPEGYMENARKIARERIALAGFRLAAILNERFK